MIMYPSRDKLFARHSRVLRIFTPEEADIVWLSMVRLTGARRGRITMLVAAMVMGFFLGVMPMFSQAQIQTVGLLALTWYFFSIAWQGTWLPAFLMKNDLAEQVLCSPISSQAYVQVLKSKLVVAAVLGMIPYLAYFAANAGSLVNSHYGSNYYYLSYYNSSPYSQYYSWGWRSMSPGMMLTSAFISVISFSYLTYWSLVARRNFLWLPAVFLLGTAYIQLSTLRGLDESLWLTGTTILLFVYVFATLIWCRHRNNLGAFAISSFSALGVHTICMKYPEIIRVIDSSSGLVMIIWSILGIVAGYMVMTYLKYRYAERLRAACFG